MKSKKGKEVQEEEENEDFGSLLTQLVEEETGREQKDREKRMANREEVDTMDVSGLLAELNLEL